MSALLNALGAWDGVLSMEMDCQIKYRALFRRMNHAMPELPTGSAVAGDRDEWNYLPWAADVGPFLLVAVEAGVEMRLAAAGGRETRRQASRSSPLPRPRSSPARSSRSRRQDLIVMRSISPGRGAYRRFGSISAIELRDRRRGLALMAISSVAEFGTPPCRKCAQ